MKIDTTRVSKYNTFANVRVGVYTHPTANGSAGFGKRGLCEVGSSIAIQQGVSERKFWRLFVKGHTGSVVHYVTTEFTRFF